MALQADGAGAEQALDHLRALLPQAEHPMPARHAMRYRFGSDGSGGIHVHEEGDLLATAPGPEAAADAAYLRMHRRAFELASLAGWVRLHGATVDLDGARVLLVGRSGVGKTTLALRLLLDGADVQGDESALVRAGRSLAVPRPVHLRAGTLDLLPELRAVVADLPRVGDVAVLDPGRYRPWRLVDAPVTHVAVLERDGRPAGVEPLGPGEVLEAMAKEAFVVTESASALVARLAPVAGAARGLRLRVGDPVASVTALRGALG